MTDSTTGPGARLIARYASPPKFTGTGTGTMSHPVMPTVLYDWATQTEKVVPETVSVTAVDATTWNVSGSVSGGHPQAKTGIAYQMSNGVTFTITAAAVPFAAGDSFSFEIAPHIDASKITGAKQFQIGDGSQIVLSSGNGGVTFGFNVFGGMSAVVAYSSGYAVVTSSGNPRSGREYPMALTGDNQPLPARGIFANSSTRGIAAFWDELRVKPTSRIYAAQLGAAGSRMLVVQWSDFAHKDDPGASYTFQLIFFENSPRVRVHYLSMKDGTGTYANGSSATIGVQPRLRDNFAALSYGAGVQDGLGIEFGEDTDADGLPVGVELGYGTNPANKFTDAGNPALSDGAQFLANLNPTSAADNAGKGTDGDGDTILDLEENLLGLNAAAADTDGDGIPDNVELASNTDPKRTDSDNDGVPDGTEDADHDGNVDAGELDPRNWDTDGDGVSDGYERTVSLDPLDPARTLFTPAATFTGVSGQLTQQSVVDSHGNVIVVMYGSNQRNNDNPDDLWIGLYSPAAGSYEKSVDATQLVSHEGYDDRQPTVVTLAGEGAVDKALVFNGTRRGHAFLTEVDLSLAARDGSASTSATVVTKTTYIPLSLSVQHPHMKLGADGNLHVAFVGSSLLGTSSNFSNNRADRGIYYMKLAPDGTVLVPPTELYRRPPPSHAHMNPRLDVDALGHVHGVFRAGACNWTAGNSNCSIHYFKMSPEGAVEVPATRLVMAGSGGIDKAPAIAVAPNGNVNIVYASLAPVIQLGSGMGGYETGRGLFLHVISSVGNQVTTLVDQVQLVAPVPQPFDSNRRIPNFVIPAVGVDAGGNLHVYSAEANSANIGTYHVFDPKGALAAGPFTVPTGAGHDQQLPTVSIVGTRAFLSYVGNDVGVTSVDFSGFGLDLSGGAQVQPPATDMTLAAVSPPRTDPGTTLVVTITGTGFLSTSQASIGGVALTNVQRYDATTLVGTLDASALAEGAHDVAVTTPGGASASLTGAFFVGTPAEPSSDDGCGCRVGGQGGAPAGAALVGLAALLGAVLVRRRR